MAFLFCFVLFFPPVLDCKLIGLLHLSISKNIPDYIFWEDGQSCILWLFHMDTVNEKVNLFNVNSAPVFPKCRHRWHLSPQQWIDWDKLQRSQTTLPDLNRKGFTTDMAHGIRDRPYTDLPKPAAKVPLRNGTTEFPASIRKFLDEAESYHCISKFLNHTMSATMQSPAPLSINGMSPTSAADWHHLNPIQKCSCKRVWGVSLLAFHTL